MAKLSLNPNPTFQASVDMPLHGGGVSAVLFTFKHKSRTEFLAWRENLAGKRDADVIADLVTAWDLDDEYTPENVDRLLEGYGGASQAIVAAYVSEILQAKRKN